MANPILNITIRAVDQAKGVVDRVRTALRGLVGEYKTTRDELGRFTTQASGLLGVLGKASAGLSGALNSALGSLVSIGGISAGLAAAAAAADRLAQANQRLSGAAKISGVPLAFLQDVADKAQQSFALTAGQAGNFAAELTKLTAKAGDITLTGDALQSFLDIGAARGLNAEETLTAVSQAILGIDEGTDKLFSANPSVLYERYAASIGTTAGKLTDQQKAQALLTAATEDGAKVQGEYARFLGTVAGESQKAANAQEAALATLGTAIEPARRALLGALTTIANGFSAFIGGIQLLASDLGFFIDSIGPRLRQFGGELLTGLANTLEKVRPLLDRLGLGGLVDRLRDNGARATAEAKAQLANIATAQEEAQREIVGGVRTGADAKAVEEANRKIKEQLALEERRRVAAAARAKQEKDAADARERAAKAAAAELEATTAQILARQRGQRLEAGGGGNSLTGGPQSTTGLNAGVEAANTTPAPAFLQGTGGGNKGFAAAVQGSGEVVEKEVEQAEDALTQFGVSLVQAAAGPLADFFETGIAGARSLGDAFGGLARAILQSLNRIIAQILARQAILALAGALFGKGSSTFQTIAAQRFATGGLVTGPGTSTSDSIPAMLSAGEYVIDAATVQAFGPDYFAGLQRAARGTPPRRYAEGGLVAPAARGEGGATNISVGLEDGLVLREFDSTAGDRVLLRRLQRNAKAAKRALEG